MTEMLLLEIVVGCLAVTLSWMLAWGSRAFRELRELRAAQDADRKVTDWLARSHNTRLRSLEASRRGVERRRDVPG
jgi:hypothetical protein